MPNPKYSALAALHSQAKKREKTEITCYHCGKTGHTKEKCYRLIGFPPNFKFTKSKPGHSSGTSSAVHSANQVASQGQKNGSLNGSQLPLTEAQIQQLVALVNAQSPQLNLNESTPSANQPKTHLTTPTDAIASK